MSQEIVYTSAPRGLKPNSSGFCTVLSTNGMARNLSERLESLSGYRFHFPAHDANAQLNPVNYSHLKMTVGGESFHILSRICDAGLDHTKRSNKLAHHVAFKAREIKPTAGGSPAWTLAASDFCETQWEGEPRRVAEGRKRLPESQRSPQPAAAWKSLTGDAGWAGVLAESALQHPPRPMHVIFPAGTDTLQLVVEALHLLPANKRWDVTFSTYFTKLEAGTECQWRFVLDGTPEAEALRRDPHKPKIDLSADPGQAPESDLVEFARTGHPPAPGPGESPAMAAPIAGDHALTPADEKQSADAHAAHAPAGNTPDAERPIAAPPRSWRPVRRRRDHTRRRLPLPWIIAGSLLLFLLITGGMIAAFVGGRGFRAAPELVGENDAPQAREAERKSVDVDPGVLESVEKPVEAPSRDPEPVVVVDEASPEEMAEVDEPPQPEPEQPAPAPLPLADVINVHKEHLPLPATEQDRSLSGGGNSALDQAKQLAEIYVDDPEKVTLRIEGQEAILPPGVQFAITEKLSPDRSMKTWEIKEATSDEAAVSNIGTRIGKFQLQDQRFSFQWQHNLQSSKLQFCRLIIEAENDAGSQTASCSLFEPYEQPPLKFDFENTVHTIDLQLDSRSLPRSEYLKMEVLVRGIAESRLTMSATTLSSATSDSSPEKVDIDIASAPAENGKSETLLRVEARFLSGNDAKEPQFHMRNQAAELGIRIENAAPANMMARLRYIPEEIASQEGYSLGDIKALTIRRDVILRDFGRDTLKSVRDATRKLKASLNKHKRSVDGLLNSTSLTAELKKEEKGDSPDGPWTTFSRHVMNLASKYADAIKEVDAYFKRLDEIQQLHQDLPKDVEIDFRVYLLVNGQETDILRSRSPAKSGPGATPGADAHKGLSPPMPASGASTDQQVGTSPSGP